MDAGGRIRLGYGNNEIDVGSAKSISETFQKSVMVVPLVSMPMERTFAVETGSGMSYRIQFTRDSPQYTNDSSGESSEWSNAEWCRRMDRAVNRWQARTDGFVLSYDPNNPYLPAIYRNGYVKSLTRTYKPGYITTINGNLQFDVGTMHVRNPKNPGSSENRSEFSIIMSVVDKEGNLKGSDTLLDASTDLEDDPVNCVDSYEVTGGPETPFEFVRMTLPANKFASTAPNVFDPENGGVHVGHTTVSIKGMRNGTFVVSKCKQSNKNYILTAYCEAEVYRGQTLLEDMTDLNPKNVIDKILTDPRYCTAFPDGAETNVEYTSRRDYTEEELVEIEANINEWVDSLWTDRFYQENPDGSEEDLQNFLKENELEIFGQKQYFLMEAKAEGKEVDDKIPFRKGTNVWYVLQVCAYSLGARIFFANGKAYLIDYTKAADLVSNGRLDLYTQDTGSTLYARVIGQVSLGDEGMDSVINTQTIRCSKARGSDEQTTVTVDDSASVSKYGQKANVQLNIPELIEDGSDTTQATQFAKGLFVYRREPQQSVTFTLKEMFKSSGETAWNAYFPVNSYAVEIKSQPDEFMVTSESALSGGTAPQLLMMSTYTTSYPEGTTEYTFGKISNIDLASSTSQILANRG